MNQPECGNNETELYPIAPEDVARLVEYSKTNGISFEEALQKAINFFLDRVIITQKAS